MEYYLNIDLLVLNEWEKCNIDLVDAAIVTYIKEKQATDAFHRNSEGLVWVSHSNLLAQLPLLRIGKKALRTRLLQLVRMKLIERWIEKRKGDQVKVYYGISTVYRLFRQWHKEKHGIEKSDMSEGKKTSL